MQRIPNVCDLQPIGSFNIQQPFSLLQRTLNIFQYTPAEKKPRNKYDTPFGWHMLIEPKISQGAHRGIMEMSSKGFAFHETLF